MRHLRKQVKGKESCMVVQDAEGLSIAALLDLHRRNQMNEFGVELALLHGGWIQ